MGSEPAPAHPGLRAERLPMAAADRTLRARLAAEDVLSGGDRPGMAALHRRHAARLAEARRRAFEAWARDAGWREK